MTEPPKDYDLMSQAASGMEWSDAIRHTVIIREIPWMIVAALCAFSASVGFLIGVAI